MVPNIFLFSTIHRIILPIDFHIFQRGRSTTNQICSSMNLRFSGSSFGMSGCSALLRVSKGTSANMAGKSQICRKIGDVPATGYRRGRWNSRSPVNVMIFGNDLQYHFLGEKNARRSHFQVIGCCFNRQRASFKGLASNLAMEDASFLLYHMPIKTSIWFGDFPARHVWLPIGTEWPMIWPGQSSCQTLKQDESSNSSIRSFRSWQRTLNIHKPPKAHQHAQSC